MTQSTSRNQTVAMFAIIATTAAGGGTGSTLSTPAEVSTSAEEVGLSYVDDTAHVLSSSAAALHAKLRSYPKLAPGWRGDDSIPPPPTAAEQAIAFLANRPVSVPLPRPEVTNDGEVGLYWDSGGIFGEIVFPGDGRYYYYAELDVDGTVVTKDGGDDIEVDGVWPAKLTQILERLGQPKSQG